MPQLNRRSFALGALAALVPATPGWAAGQPPVLTFAAYRNGKRVGGHRMTFDLRGETLTVRTDVEMAVKLGPVTAYRYVHEAVERWSAGRFERLETRTVAGGKPSSVVATRGPAGVAIGGKGVKPVVAGPNALPFTHWNIAIARAPLFNPQTGELLQPTVRSLGRSPIAAEGGRLIEARRVAFSGEANIDNWYDADDVWCGLRGRLDDGSMMEYRRL